METSHLEMAARQIYNLKDAILTEPDGTKVALAAGTRYLLQNRGGQLVNLLESSAMPPVQGDFAHGIEDGETWTVMPSSASALYVWAVRATRIIVSEA